MSPKKKIVYLITKSNFGGAQRYVFDLATSLPKEAFDVTVICGGKGLLYQKLSEAGITTISLTSLERDVSIGKDAHVFIDLWRILRSISPDVVHLNSSKMGGIGAFVSRLLGIPHIIFTGHGWAFNENRTWISKKIITFFHWLTILLTHTTIAVSEKTAKDVSHLPFIKNKIKVIYNGVSEYELLSQEEARERLLPGQKEKIWVGTISELHPTKGLAYAICGFKQALREFPSAIFVIIGEGDQRTELELLIKRENLQENVFLLGSVLNAKKYLKALDIFTLTSITEALPYAVIEAGFAGVPVIASKVGGIPEIIIDADMGILIPSKDSSAISQALTTYLEDPLKRLDAGKVLQSFVISHFSLKTMVLKTSALYTLNS